MALLSSLKDHAKGIAHNLIANLIIIGVAGLISWYTANKAYIQGVPPYLAILIGVGAFFLLAIGFAAIAWGIIKFRNGESLTTIEPAGPTHIRLQFNLGNILPLALEQWNIWRWYVLKQVVITTDLNTSNQTTETIFTTLFLVFDKPVFINQFRVDGGGASLPQFEVKDSGARHAIIVFSGGLAGLVLDIHVV
jgi:hypothetical protein